MDFYFLRYHFKFLTFILLFIFSLTFFPFFVNLCINYDGQEELIDSFRIIARKIKSSTLDPDSITKEEIKENVYSSYFIPPDVIIITGKRKFFGGFLLWDSIKSKIYFSDILWPDIKIDDLISIIQKIFK